MATLAIASDRPQPRERLGQVRLPEWFGQSGNDPIARSSSLRKVSLKHKCYSLEPLRFSGVFIVIIVELSSMLTFAFYVEDDRYDIPTLQLDSYGGRG